MELLKFDLKIPYWCSFRVYGTLNLQQTYPFPPPPTIFGLIQNALQKPAIHTIEEDKCDGIIKKMLDDYAKLKFSIIIREKGEKIDDYLNIMKGNRERNSSRSALKDLLSNECRKLEKQLNREGTSDEKIMKSLKDYEETFWIEKKREFGSFAIEKNWMRTQVNRQRLITPEYTIYVNSTDNDEYSLKNLSNALKNPKRPLYIGESDDLVDVVLEGDGIIEVINTNHASTKIASVLPDLYPNCQVVNIPIKLRHDKTDDNHSILCSILRGELEREISCVSVPGENIVFL